MDWTDIQTALYAWIVAETGLTARWANQNAPRPAYPFVELNVSAEAGMGVDEVRYETPAGVDPDLNVHVVGQRQFTLSVQVFTRSQWPEQNARFYIGKIRNSLRKPSVIQDLRAVQVAIIAADNALDISGLSDGGLESRMSLDIRLAGSVSNTDGTSSYIKTVEMQGDLQGTNNPPTFERTEDFGTLGDV